MPFLQNVTRGRGIPPERLEAVAEHYYAVGGVSPINQQCRDLIAAIGKDFAAAGVDLPIYWGNRNWDPYLTATVAEMAAAGVRRALAFVTSAYGSYSSCRQYLDDIERARAETGPGAPEIDKIRHFYQPPGVHRAVRRRHRGGHRVAATRRPRGRPARVHRAQRAGRHGRGQRAAAGRPLPVPAGRGVRAHRRTGQRRHRRRAPLAAGLPEPQRAPVAALARPGRMRLPGGPGPGRSSWRGPGPGRLHQRPHGGRPRSGRRGGGDRPAPRAAAGPRRDPQYGPALRLDDHRAGHRTAGGPGQPGGAGLPGLRHRRLLPPARRGGPSWPPAAAS